MFTRATHRTPSEIPTATVGPCFSAGTGSFLPLRIQPKLVLGAVDDPLEREADRMAERVVARIPGPLGLSSLGSAAIQRCDDPINDDCGACEDLDEEQPVDVDEDVDAPDSGSRKRGRTVEVIDFGMEVDQDGAADEEPEPGGRRRKEHRVAVNAKRQPNPAPPPSGAVAAGVEGSIRQAQAAGEPLAEPVRQRMEQAFGVGFGRVRVHSDVGADRLNRALSARAFTTGPHIFFRQGENRPESPAGERLLAHELTHVVQQGAAEAGHRGASPRFLAPALGRVAGGAIAQRKEFEGPQFGKKGNDNTLYPGHTFGNGGANPNTGCGIHNSIQTAGEEKNNKKSNPGTPTDFLRYKQKKGKTSFSRPAGLLLDPSTKKGCAVTRMHLINHRLGSLADTQGQADNILLGTRISNNPRHLHDVEEPVIQALNHSSEANADYEQAMTDAVPTKQGAKNALFWKKGQEPVAGVLKEAPAKAFLRKGKAKFGVVAKAVDAAQDVAGVALKVDAKTPGRNHRHLWLDYSVAAKYGAVPAYVKDNIKRETKHNKLQKKGKQKNETALRIKEFSNTWAPEAFPPTFDCDVSYYSASYEPGNIYLKETEHHNMRTDLK